MTNSAPPEIKLQQGPQGLELQIQGADAPGPVSVDFGSGRLRHRRRGGHNEALGRAVGLKTRPGLELVDATAGLGSDSFVLADLGCSVTMIERNSLVHAILADGLHRAQGSEDEWLREVASRMRLLAADSRDWLLANPNATDVVYLDPMFPERGKSARVKKEMWLFQQLLGVTELGDDLLPAAINAARWRVVVKRPVRAEPLPGARCHHTIPGKTVRFDVYNIDQLR